MSLFKRLRIIRGNIVFVRIKDIGDGTKLICDYCIHHSYNKKNKICLVCISKANIEFLNPYRIRTIGYVHRIRKKS
jgi:hypothetical protein